MRSSLSSGLVLASCGHHTSAVTRPQTAEVCHPRWPWRAVTEGETGLRALPSLRTCRRRSSQLPFLACGFLERSPRVQGHSARLRQPTCQRCWHPGAPRSQPVYTAPNARVLARRHPGLLLSSPVGPHAEGGPHHPRPAPGLRQFPPPATPRSWWAGRAGSRLSGLRPRDAGRGGVRPQHLPTQLPQQPERTRLSSLGRASGACSAVLARNSSVRRLGREPWRASEAKRAQG